MDTVRSAQAAEWDEIELDLAPETTSRPDVWGAVVPPELCFLPALRNVMRVIPKMLSPERRRVLNGGGVPLVVEYRKVRHVYEPHYVWQRGNRNELYVAFLGVSELGYLLVDVARYFFWLGELAKRRIKVNDLQYRFYVEPLPDTTWSLVTAAHALADRVAYTFADFTNRNGEVIGAWLDGKPLGALKPIDHPAMLLCDWRERDAVHAAHFDAVQARLPELWGDLKYRLHVLDHRENAEPMGLEDAVRAGAIARWEAIEQTQGIPPCLFGSPC